jgi:hypothetical protein
MYYISVQLPERTEESLKNLKKFSLWAEIRSQDMKLEYEPLHHTTGLHSVVYHSVTCFICYITCLKEGDTLL